MSNETAASIEDPARLADTIVAHLGIKLEGVGLNELGRAKKIIIDKDNTTIIEGGGKSTDIKGRIDQIRRRLLHGHHVGDRRKLGEDGNEPRFIRTIMKSKWYPRSSSVW